MSVRENLDHALGRPRPDDRAPQRHTRSDDVQKAPDREARREEDGGECDVHEAPTR